MSEENRNVVCRKQQQQLQWVDWVTQLLYLQYQNDSMVEEREKVKFFASKVNLFVIFFTNCLKILGDGQCKHVLEEFLSELGRHDFADDVYRLAVLGCLNTVSKNVRDFLDEPYHIFWRNLMDCFDSLISFMFGFSEAVETGMTIHVNGLGLNDDLLFSTKICKMIAEIVANNQFTLLHTLRDDLLIAEYEKLELLLGKYANVFSRVTTYFTMCSFVESVSQERVDDCCIALAVQLASISDLRKETVASPRAAARTLISRRKTPTGEMLERANGAKRRQIEQMCELLKIYFDSAINRRFAPREYKMAESVILRITNNKVHEMREVCLAEF